MDEPLSIDRLCPRCSETAGEKRVTRWTNEPDFGVILACTVCKVTTASELTAGERLWVAALDAKPVKRLRRAYVTL